MTTSDAEATVPPTDRYPALGALAVRGDDAATFLRAQLSNDVLRLGPDTHFLAAWCDAKGRARAIFRVCENDGGYLLLLPRRLAAAVLPTLRMFVLRSAVTIEDISDRLVLSGLFGGRDLPTAGRCARDAEHLVLGLSEENDSMRRALCVGDAPARSVDLDADTWQLSEIDAGLPTLEPATGGLFVPQMLNLHWLLAIDFDKGCYPGQEVIARLHYRGRLTRRLFRCAWQGPSLPMPGDAVVDAAGASQGTVIRAAIDGADTEGRLLAVLRVDAAETLVCGEAQLACLDLPYPTPDTPNPG